MLFFFEPDHNAIRAFLDAQKDQSFSYPEVGASRERAPTGYVLDHNRVQLGCGDETFERAIEAVRLWKMFDMHWLELCWPDVPIEVGSTVAVLVSHLRFWSLNACRIVYLIEEHGAVERFGFAYGTLSQHGEIGEERFTVEMDSAEGSVWYDVYAFSRPGPLARLAYPYTRRLQKRFARDSMLCMQRAVSDASTGINAMPD